MELGPGQPTPPIPLSGGAGSATSRFTSSLIAVSDEVVTRLGSVCKIVTTSAAELAEASRDWWPLAMIWALDSQTAALASVVCRPSTDDEVADVLAVCHDARIPVTAAGGRSGVLGSSIPAFGGVLLDLCGLSGIRAVDPVSMVVDVAAGTFGDHMEDELRREHGLTVGHWPQSMSLATVGGWIACRGAGQLSTRYGKIEDIVCGLDVVLADGTRITTGGLARQAAGPDLTQLFVGSEGTLGIVTSARLRAHPAPVAERRTAWGFPTVGAGFDAMRGVLQRGATPAVLRLYDATESARNYHLPPEAEGFCVLLALDEGDPLIVETMIRIVERQAESAGAIRLSDTLVEHWMAKRNDVAALEALITRGIVVDTMEVTGNWVDLPRIYQAVIAAMTDVPGTVAVSAHQSHSYTSGGCLYFTFAGKVDEADPSDKVDGASKVDGTAARTAYHRAVWDAGIAASLGAGASLSHHHGVGLGRGASLATALGPAFAVLQSVKDALDPAGILNPGKLGLTSPFGETPSW